VIGPVEIGGHILEQRRLKSIHIIKRTERPKTKCFPKPRGIRRLISRYCDAARFDF